MTSSQTGQVFFIPSLSTANLISCSSMPFFASRKVRRRWWGVWVLPGNCSWDKITVSFLSTNASRSFFMRSKSSRSLPKAILSHFSSLTLPTAACTSRRTRPRLYNTCRGSYYRCSSLTPWTLWLSWRWCWPLWLPSEGAAQGLGAQATTLRVSGISRWDEAAGVVVRAPAAPRVRGLAVPRRDAMRLGGLSLHGKPMPRGRALLSFVPLGLARGAAGC